MKNILFTAIIAILTLGCSEIHQDIEENIEKVNTTTIESFELDSLETDLSFHKLNESDTSATSKSSIELEVIKRATDVQHH